MGHTNLVDSLVEKKNGGSNSGTVIGNYTCRAT